MCKSPKKGAKSKLEIPIKRTETHTFCKVQKSSNHFLHFLLGHKFRLSGSICSRSGSVPGSKKGEGRNRGHAIQLCLLDDLVAPSPPIKMLACPGRFGSGVYPRFTQPSPTPRSSYHVTYHIIPSTQLNTPPYNII